MKFDSLCASAYIGLYLRAVLLIVVSLLTEYMYLPYLSA